MRNRTPAQLWQDFIKEFPQYAATTLPPAEHFCATEKPANELAQLVLQGEKTGTCGALVSYRMAQDDLPKEGDLYIVTDWAGNAICLTKTTKVFVQKYKDADESWARKEGEGDLSYEYWNKAHWDFFTTDLAQFGLKPTREMEIVCEEFEMIFS